MLHAGLMIFDCPVKGMKRLLVLFVAMLCMPLHALASGTIVTAAPFALPASFTSPAECADCVASRLLLDMRPSGLFLLSASNNQSAEVVSNDPEKVSIGFWGLSHDDKVVVLDQGRNGIHKLVFDNASGRLQALDSTSTLLQENSLDYLQRTNEYTPVTASYRIHGMLRYVDDIGLLQECLSKQTFSVSENSVSTRLRGKYDEYQKIAGRALLTSLVGNFSTREKTGDSGTRDVVVVELIEDINPDATCNDLVMASLIGTHWRLTSLNGEVINPARGTQQPYMIFQPVAGRINGYGGCNRFFGDYEVQDKQLSIGQLATSRKFCDQGVNIEKRLITALQETRKFVIKGRSLQLYTDEQEIPVAVFNAESF
jgi:heat shock protein HslJ